MSSKGRILVVDDEPQVGMIFSKVLQSVGYEVVAAESGEEAVKKMQTKPDVVFLDIKLPGMDGVETLRRIRKNSPDVPVVMMTAYQTVDSAVESMRLGACDYLIKPLDNNRIKEVVRHALLVGDAPSLNMETGIVSGEMVGVSEAFRHTQELIAKVAPTDLPVLLLGESGTGKELTARAIHLESKRASKAFVPVDCASLPETLMESELFGYEKGAFTGAEDSRQGRFEMADEGTLFLDEIGNLSMSVQAKLLRVLQDPSFVRLGGRKQIRVNTRIVCATNKDLESASARGEFREDLYHRIKVFTIELTPLRNRLGDIPVLVNHYLEKYSQEMGTPTKKINPKVLSLFQNYRWPGNIRELSNALRSAVVLADDTIEIEHLPTSIRFSQDQKSGSSSSASDAALKDVIKKVEREHILATLKKTQWSLAEAAKILGIEKKSLQSKIKEYGLSKT
ncbi:MAG: Regulatory protein AtoC [Elusimicrobia bacterium]|nr:Regulatory protein AtoC [Elusimicrobiota bacterium]